MGRKPGRRGGVKLGGKRPVEIGRSHPRMGVRKAGDADLDDAAFLHQATFDEFDGGMEWAGGGLPRRR